MKNTEALRNRVLWIVGQIRLMRRNLNVPIPVSQPPAKCRRVLDAGGVWAEEWLTGIGGESFRMLASHKYFRENFRNRRIDQDGLSLESSN